MMVNQHFNQSILNQDPITGDGIAHRKTFPTAHIESPAVQGALDYMTAERSVAQRSAAVRTAVVSGIKFALRVIDGEFVTILQLKDSH